MPINIGPEAQAAWERYQDAKTTSDKIQRLEEYISLVPKHKGVEKHLKQCKITLSKLREELQKEKTARKGTGEKWMVPKEADAQICFVGLPNCGKSALINFLCGKNAVEVADYPFTTIKPQVATINVKGAQVQLVDLPALVDGSSLGNANGSRVFAQIRNADLVVLVIDLSQDPIEQLELLFKEFRQARLKLNEFSTKLRFEKSGKGGIVVINPEYYSGGREGLIDLLQSLRVTNCRLILEQPVTEDEIIEFVRIKVQSKKAAIIATKGDMPGSKSNYQKLKSYLNTKYPNKFNIIIPVSIKFKGTKVNNPDQIGEDLFQALGRIRVYTRNEKGVAEKPIVINQGATVKDIAEKLGKPFLQNFRFAKIWGTSIKFDGQRAGLDHELADLDQVQIFA